ncbi:class I SAM-dependent methyltransferase [Halolamina salifodinae]|uniref:2-polyprenyl-3-methyl-5-hydroxy-6-metoxy-1, 4-benzoquinol methylase n=1 Tax=Halolamina salifodinae TaxID=1202767 RepID=A0A8T4H1N0_9EURY|nr:class I SAM-dependent methyltransferase [Halolamina salifodinae]MBP1988253.1 2-polyprenyl-3-methyl-5-hydroxy-6-metoxy-1,4-benzoquinol methylase [Halolamina salifodinae]
MSDDDERVTVAGYDRLADATDLDQWESPWGDSHYQRHYVWPAAASMLPEVDGLDVLDAGCGVGSYTEWFHDNGAAVVAVDASEDALASARERCPEDVTFYQQNLTEPFEFADSDSFDLVFSNLVLDHIEDWCPVFETFARVLRPGGTVVFTTIHPFRRYLNHRDDLANYYETEGYVVEWGSTDVEIESYYRPIGEVVNAVADAGFRIDEFREARPQESYEDHQPERYESAMAKPDTLCVRVELPGNR